jgi:hypothetical protein
MGLWKNCMATKTKTKTKSYKMYLGSTYKPFCQSECITLSNHGKKERWNLGYFLTFKKMPKVNNRQVERKFVQSGHSAEISFTKTRFQK